MNHPHKNSRLAGFGGLSVGNKGEFCKEKVCALIIPPVFVHGTNSTSPFAKVLCPSKSQDLLLKTHQFMDPGVIR